MDELSFVSSSQEFLIKVALFAVVQVLVYLILSKSSALFEKADEKTGGDAPSRSPSVRHVLAAVSDLSAGGELQPSSASPSNTSASACAEAISAAIFTFDFNEGFSL